MNKPKSTTRVNKPKPTTQVNTPKPTTQVKLTRGKVNIPAKSPAPMSLGAWYNIRQRMLQNAAGARDCAEHREAAQPNRESLLSEG